MNFTINGSAAMVFDTEAVTTSIHTEQEFFGDYPSFVPNYDWDIQFPDFMEELKANLSILRNGTRTKANIFQISISYLNLYFTPAIIFIGLVGNFLSFLVFTFTHVQRLSASIYLSSLAVADILFLLALAIPWIDRSFGITLFATEGWCQLVVFVSNFSGFMAVWNVLGFTAERYIIAYHPLKKDVLCTRQKAIIVVVCLAVFALLYYSYVIWTYDIIRYAGKTACSPIPRYDDITNILSSIDTLIACVMPSIVVVILNIKIMIKIHQYQTKQVHSQTALVKHGTFVRNRSVIHTSVSTTGSVHIRFSTNRLKELNNINELDSPEMKKCQAVIRGRSQFRTARMLLVLSSIFVLLNLPYHIFRVQFSLGHLIGIGPKAPKTRQVWHEFFQLLYFLNFAINFFIYSACGRQFRVGLKRLSKRWKHKLHLCRKEFHKMGRNGNLRFERTEEVVMNAMKVQLSH